MHDTALAIGRQFFGTYLPDRPASVLEIGSQDVNGGLRRCAPAGSLYVGLDLCAAPGVDVIAGNLESFPFADATFDALVSSSCFEHVQFFWLTFLEMVRVTKPGGYLYIDAPSNGAYHRYPTDNWRFYPDAGLALQGWARHQGHEIGLEESFVARSGAEGWNDCVMVFRKGGGGPPERRGRLADAFPSSFNIRIAGRPELLNPSAATEDMLRLQRASWDPRRRLRGAAARLPAPLRAALRRAAVTLSLLRSADPPRR